MNNEAFKQNISYVAHDYVDNLFCLGSCGDSISVKLRFCRAAVSRRRSSDVDDATIQRCLKRSSYAVGVTLRFHPEASS